MSENIEFENIKLTRMLVKDFTINKKFVHSDTVFFTLNLHFYGDVHLTNWGRFNTYDSARRFGSDMMRIPVNDQFLLECMPSNPEERIEVQGECSAE